MTRIASRGGASVAPAEPAALMDRPAAPPRRPARAGRMLARVLDPLAWLGFAALIAAWYLASEALGPIRLPRPDVVLSTMWTGFLESPVLAGYGAGENGISGNLAATTLRTLAGVAVGAALGIALGVLTAWSRVAGWLVRPPLELMRLVPSLIAVPFLVLWFGVGTLPQFLLIAGYTLLTLQVNAYHAVTNLPPECVRYARTLGAGRWRVLRTVVAPAIVPELVGGVRVTLQLAWGLAVVAELIGARNGVGQMMALMYQIFRTDYIIAGILWVAVVAVAVDWLLKLVFARATEWADAGDERVK